MAPADIAPKTTYAELMAQVDKNITGMSTSPYYQLVQQTHTSVEAARRLMSSVVELDEEHEQRQGDFLSSTSHPEGNNTRSAALAKRAADLKNTNKLLIAKVRARRREAAAQRASQAENIGVPTLSKWYFKEDHRPAVERSSKDDDEDWVIVDGMEDWEILGGT